MKAIALRMSKAYVLERGHWQQEKPERVGAFGFRLNFHAISPQFRTGLLRFQAVVEFGGFYNNDFYPVRQFEVGWLDENDELHWLVTEDQRRFLYVRLYDTYLEGLFSIKEDEVHPLIASSVFNERLVIADLESRYAQEYALYLRLPAEIALCRFIFGMTERPEGGNDYDRYARRPQNPHKG